MSTVTYPKDMIKVRYKEDQLHRKYELTAWRDKEIDLEEASQFLNDMCNELSSRGLSLTKKTLDIGKYEIGISPDHDIRILPDNIDEIIRVNFSEYFRAIPVQG